MIARSEYTNARKSTRSECLRAAHSLPARLSRLEQRGSVLVATSLAAFVGARRVVRPGQPLAAYALGDDKATALAILLPYRPPAALCVVGPKPPLCFFVEPQPASFRHRNSSAESLLLLIVTGGKCKTQGKRVALQLRLSRWRCRNRECGQTIFRERFGEVVAPWARRRVGWRKSFSCWVTARADVQPSFS